MATLVAATNTLNTNAGNKTNVTTPARDELIVIFTYKSGETTDPAVTDNNSDGFGTTPGYVKITSGTRGGTDNFGVWVRQTLIGSNTSTTFTRTASADTGGGLSVCRVAGMFKEGADAVIRSGLQDNGTAATTPAPSWSSGDSANPSNLILGSIWNATNPAGMTQPTGYSEPFTDGGYATPNRGNEVVNRDSGETGSTITWGSTSASAFSAIIVELDIRPIVLVLPDLPFIQNVNHLSPI